MSTLYLRTFFVTLMTGYIGLALKHFRSNPELVAQHTYLSLVLILVIASAITGIVLIKRQAMDVVLTATATLSLLQFIEWASFDTLKLAGIVAGWLIMLVLILFAHQFTKHWSAEPRRRVEVEEVGIDLVTS